MRSIGKNKIIKFVNFKPTMKQYCINDFLDKSFGYISYARQEKLSNLSIQIEDLLAESDGYAKKGKIIGKLNAYNKTNLSLQSVSDIIAPSDGYYFFDTRFLLFQVEDVNTYTKFLKYYEDLGDDIENEDSEKEYFINKYNKLMPDLYNYYHRFVEVIGYKEKYASLGVSTCEIGVPQTKIPIDFLSILDNILANRHNCKENKLIRDCETLIHMTENATSILQSCLILFPDKKKVLINHELLSFDRITKCCRSYFNDTLFIYNGNKPLVLYSITNANHRYIFHVEKVIKSIIKANKSNDYTKLYKGASTQTPNVCTYTLRELMEADDLEQITPVDKLELRYANRYDLDNYEGEEDKLLSHYCLDNEPLLELLYQNGDTIAYISTFKEGYYRVEMPSFFSPAFLDIPLVTYATKGWTYKQNESRIPTIDDFEYSIHQDRFSKTYSIEWELGSRFQILPVGWYEFVIEFKYHNSVPTILLGFQNGYSKKILAAGIDSNEKDFVFYLLLENGKSLIFNNRNFVDAYVDNQNKYFLIEYELDEQVMSLFTKYAVEAVRIVTPEGHNYEYDAEPLFFDEFKKYAKLYYEAVAKCNPLLSSYNNEHTSEPCCVYLMHDATNGFYKIGISNNPVYRERTLQSEKPTIELIKAKEFPVRKIAEAFESALHKTYESKRIRGEWFMLNMHDVSNIKTALS